MKYQVKKRWEYFTFSDNGQFSRFINSFNIDPRTDFIDRSWVAGRFAHQRGVCGLFLVDEEQVERMHQWLQSKKNQTYQGL